jgi:hypothetical protein
MPTHTIPMPRAVHPAGLYEHTIAAPGEFPAFFMHSASNRQRSVGWQ